MRKPLNWDLLDFSDTYHAFVNAVTSYSCLQLYKCSGVLSERKLYRMTDAVYCNGLWSLSHETNFKIRLMIVITTFSQLFSPL